LLKGDACWALGNRKVFTSHDLLQSLTESGLEVSLVRLLEHFNIQSLIRYDPLQSLILTFQLLQLFRVSSFQTPVLILLPATHPLRDL